MYYANDFEAGYESYRRLGVERAPCPLQHVTQHVLCSHLTCTTTGTPALEFVGHEAHDLRHNLVSAAWME